MEPEVTFNKRRRRKQRLAPEERTKLTGSIIEESIRKIGLIAITLGYEEKRNIRRGEILRRIIQANFPDDIDGIADQVRRLIDEFNLMETEAKERLVIFDDLEAIRKIYEVADQIRVSTGMVVDALALYLPDLRDDGGPELTHIPAKKQREEA